MLETLFARVDALEAAIKAHRDQKADDRCIEDDDRLYAVLGDGILCDRRVGSKEEMLHNCARFIDRRTEGGKWPTYAELEARKNLLDEEDPSPEDCADAARIKNAIKRGFSEEAYKACEKKLCEFIDDNKLFDANQELERLRQMLHPHDSSLVRYGTLIHFLEAP